MEAVLRECALFLAMAGVVGILAHLLGEALPREKFDATRTPFAPWKWEQNGKVYHKLGIERWKNRLPDKSRYVKSTVEKSIHADCSAAHFESLARETCVAEAVHWALLLISPLFLLVLHTFVGVTITVLYGLSNLPFIAIQLYNRPRLVRLYQRACGAQPGGCAQSSRREDAGHAAAHSVLQ